MAQSWSRDAVRAAVRVLSGYGKSRIVRSAGAYLLHQVSASLRLSPL